MRAGDDEQPDIVVVCDEKKLDEKGCKGAPDLVIEIISPSTAAMDLKIKLPLYEANKIKEYWIADPDKKIIMIFKLDKKRKYGKPDVYSKEDKIDVKIFKGLEINLNDIFK